MSIKLFNITVGKLVVEEELYPGYKGGGIFSSQ